ncbi:MAG TPA: hypothetical protein VF862_12540, partial [Gemmatimonadales bacterium]
CAECRGEAIEAGRIVRAGAQHRRRQAGGLALAAAVLLAVWFGMRAPEPTAVLRNAPSAASPAEAAAPVPVSPVGGTRRSDGPMLFRWRALPGTVEYRVTLLDASGTVLWTQLTTDTSFAMPLAISLAPRDTYFWYVDALRSDGSSTTSGAQAFGLTP